MKLVCEQSELKTGLSKVIGAVPSRPTHPVLANVLFVANGDEIELTGFDLSVGVKVNVPATVQEKGAITIPAKLFTEIVNRLDGEVEIETVEDTLVIRCGGEFVLNTIRAEEYPSLPEIDSEFSITLSTQLLLDGVKSTLFAASSDETKMILTCLNILVENNDIELAGTDGHRLAVFKSESEFFSERINIPIPNRALTLLERIIQNSKDVETITIVGDENQIKFEMKKQSLVTRKLSGSYPNYNNLLPKEFERTVTVDRKLFLCNVERVSILAEKNPLVKISLNKETEEMEIFLENKEIGQAKAVIPCQITGESQLFAFNIKYLVEGLKAINTSEVLFKSNGAGQPVIFSPLGGQQLIYLLMPVQIRN